MPSITPSSTERDPQLICLTARLDRVVRAVALWGGGTMLLGLTMITVADVGMRYFCNAPIFGARDIARLMLILMVAASIGYSARTGGQVAIEVFSAFLGPRQLRVVDIGVRILAAAMLSVMAWRLVLGGLAAGRFGEVSLTLGIPYAPFYFLLAGGLLLYAVVLLVEIALLSCGYQLDHHVE